MSKRPTVLMHERPKGAKGAVRLRLGVKGDVQDMNVPAQREYAWHANGVLTRDRTKGEAIQLKLKEQFARCGWVSSKLKVVTFISPERVVTFYVNIGFLRGLEPNALYEILCKLPHKCGHKKILAAISRLPEAVVGAPHSTPAGESNG